MFRTARHGMILLLSGCLLLAIETCCRATTPSKNELNEARRWAQAKFEGKVEEAPVQSGFVVLANHDPVQRNARGGRPLNIAGNLFRRGLYCHAPSKVEVHLPGPASAFRALVGVDSNEQTSGGRGSVVFIVRVGDREMFRSPLMHEGMKADRVHVDLAGATTFTLEVTDGSDGISCDQADWADAQVSLQDNKTMALGDLDEITSAPEYPAQPAFSFLYGGKASGTLLKTWPVRRTTRELDANRVRHEQVWTDPETKLEVRCTGVVYRDFPNLEWTVTFTNRGTKAAPLLEKIQGLDWKLAVPQGTPIVLRFQRGSTAEPNDYQPLETTFDPGASKRFAPRAGRATDPWIPYFNLHWGNRGLIVVVGWPGQWAAEFARDASSGFSIRAGQEITHLRLNPGETIRTPLMVLQFHEGDWIRAQNLWRRWMLAHNLPRPGGKLIQPEIAACSSHQFGEMIHANEANQKLFIDRYLQEGIKLDYWWMDAGWYKNRTGWPDVGTWEVDTRRFPHGLRAITDHAHQKNVKSIVWFEPERVVAGTWLATQHPEWVLGGKNGGLLDLGNDQARAWLTDHVDRLIVDQGIDLYRQDFNMDPLSFWRKHDAPDRQGATENHHIQGYLAYWDELRRRHPGMLIDTCASGGRRNDLETLRRAVPLLRSDYILEPVGQQAHTYGISFWIPFYGTGINSEDRYVFYSQMAPHLTACYDMRRGDLNLRAIRRHLVQWILSSRHFLGDYYPLTPYDLSDSSWIAWQFDEPERGRGMVQAFRREASVYETARFRLRGLEPGAEYVVHDLNSDDSKRTELGSELMEHGLGVTIATQPGAAIVAYRRKEKNPLASREGAR
ncbi:MAG: NPCBM/NEW2 domain-containing protein [Isosphaeraceae bacterium]